MHRPLRVPRGVTAVALVLAPVAVVLAGPASAAGVEVTPAPDGCGVVVTLTGLGDGTRTAVVRTTVAGTGTPVPVVTDPPAGEARDPDTGAEPSLSPTAAPEPQLVAVRTIDGDGEALVVLDAEAVPDTDPRVAVDVAVDGVASLQVELALPGCSTTVAPEPTGTPTAEPTGTPTAEPTATPTTTPTTDESQAPAAPLTPTATPTPTATATATATATLAPATAGSPTASPSGTPTDSPPPATPATTASAVAGADTSPAGPASQLVPAAPVDDGVEQDDDTSTGDTSTGGTGTSGTGTSGVLSLVSFAAAPVLDAAPEPAPVPDPVIAVPEGSAAGLLAQPETPGTPLSDLLPELPALVDEPVPAQLAAPDLATDAAADPLVDLAPAAFVLSASLGGLLMTGRRRTS